MNCPTRGLAPAMSLLCLLILTPGCGDQAVSDRPETYPVSGVVTQNGTPVEGANVVFELADGSKSAVGTTDAQGRYTLTTFEAGDGAIAGRHKVTVSKYDRPATSSATGDAADAANEDVGDYETADSETDADLEPKNLLPPQYADPATSGFTADVTADGPNEFNFDLM